MNMKKKIFVIAFVLLVLVAIGTVFAQQYYTQPNLSWSGTTVTARNPNPRRSGNAGTMKGIQVCVIYRDGGGMRREFYSSSFDLAPGGSHPISAPGEVLAASVAQCSVIYGD